MPFNGVARLSLYRAKSLGRKPCSPAATMRRLEGERRGQLSPASPPPAHKARNSPRSIQRPIERTNAAHTHDKSKDDSARWSSDRSTEIEADGRGSGGCCEGEDEEVGYVGAEEED